MAASRPELEGEGGEVEGGEVEGGEDEGGEDEGGEERGRPSRLITLLDAALIVRWWAAKKSRPTMGYATSASMKENL